MAEVCCAVQHASQERVVRYSIRSRLQQCMASVQGNLMRDTFNIVAHNTI